MEIAKVGHEPQVTIQVESDGCAAAMQVNDSISDAIRSVAHIRVA
jgi:metal-sulfur cluster biosynthetic enzyme